MEMRTRIPINATLDPELVIELDEWIASRPIRTTRAAVIEAAIRKLLADEKAKEKKGGR
jgi:metal-responsive CopG/Arc/MetJ family transcriptional regulator